MAVDTQKRNKRQTEFVRESYDRLTIALPKGTKERYRTKAKEQGTSLNAVIAQLLAEYFKDEESPV